MSGRSTVFKFVFPQNYFVRVCVCVFFFLITVPSIFQMKIEHWSSYSPEISLYFDAVTREVHLEQFYSHYQMRVSLRMQSDGTWYWKDKITAYLQVCLLYGLQVWQNYVIPIELKYFGH